MPPHSRWRVRRVSLLAIATLACGLCLLAPAIAAARGRRQLQAAVSEEALSTAPPQAGSEAPSTKPPGEAPAGDAPGEAPAVNPPAESTPSQASANPRREARRARRSALSAAAVCSVDLQATPSLVTGATALRLAGTLSCPDGADAAAQTVTLYEKLAHTPGFNLTATTSTEADGKFQFSPPALEFNSVFYVLCDGAKSTRASVKLAPQVTISTPEPGTQLPAGSARAKHAGADDANVVTFTGTVSPTETGASVSLQREYRKGAWHRIGGGGVIDAEGKYSILHTFSRPGEANLRVVVHSHGLYATTPSAPVPYLISRRRNRQVTIGASANPIVSGLSVRISGTLAGAINQPVVLLARTAGASFAALAEATSSGDEYSFTESPLQSTDYRVSSGGVTSAIFSENVTAAPTGLTSSSTGEAAAPPS